jgi:hypothetical protein
MPETKGASVRTSMLDVLQNLNRINNSESPRDASYVPWLLPSAANLLRLLTESSVFGKTVPAPDFKPIVEALKSFHTTLQSDAGANYSQDYAEFEELASTLRKQSAAVDRRLGVLDSPTRSKATLHAVQQTLFVQCANRGKTAARFRVVNRTGKASFVNFRPRLADISSVTGVAELALNFEPTGLHLEPLQAAICKAVIDLSKCSHIPDQTLEMGADVYLNSELTLKLFLSVEVYDEHA